MNPLKVIKEKKIRGNSALVYLRLCLRATKMCDRNESVYCIVYPQKELCEELSLSINTVTAAISRLERLGLVKSERVGGGKPNLLYIRNVDVTGGDHCGDI